MNKKNGILLVQCPKISDFQIGFDTFLNRLKEGKYKEPRKTLIYGLESGNSYSLNHTDPLFLVKIIKES